MRGYSIISDEERQAIIKQHESVYDGYAVGNVPSNMYPLTVADYATDKGGITVNNKGEVTTYKNHLVNESEVKQVMGDINKYSPMSYVKKILSGEMSIEEVSKETGLPLTILSKLANKLSGKPLEVKEYASADTNYDEVDSAYDFQSGGPEEFEPDYETDPMDSDIQAIQNMFDFQSQNDSDPDAREMVKNSEKAMNQEFSGKEKYGDETNAYDFQSDGPDDAYESVIKEDDNKKSLSDIARELMLSQRFEKIANEMEPSEYGDEFDYADDFIDQLLSDYDGEDFYDDLFDTVKDEYGDIILSMYGRPHDDDDDEDMYESVIEENMCEQCGMTETLCECWMGEEVEEDLQESLKQEKEKITEMFNRFKKYN
jgi:hypothetical protein